jgi:uncharacterized membrane protein YoaK (UPF0700 family)
VLGDLFMPINYARRLTGRDRTTQADRHLGFTLAFVAGATNAGGYLAVKQYTSHMTGIVSAMADNLVLGAYDVVLGGAGGLLAFLLGAACSALLVNYARRRQMQSEYAIPLLLEAFLLLCFGMMGARLAGVGGFVVPITVMLLCFIMGLQNAVITKLSHAEIRTTHITGIVTDIGIELGRWVYWHTDGATAPAGIMLHGSRLRVLVMLVIFFFVGGIAGALGFKQLGYTATIPLSLALVMLAGIPVADDLLALIRVRK